jgi:hypothetical protein
VFVPATSISSDFKITCSPASPSELSRLLSAVGGLLPLSYLDFLAQSNGAESCEIDKTGACLVLWSAQEVQELNEAYGIQRYLPTFLAIGSDGGDDAIGFNRTTDDPEKWPVVRVGFGSLEQSACRLLASGFREWRQQRFELTNPRLHCGGG